MSDELDARAVRRVADDLIRKGREMVEAGEVLLRLYPDPAAGRKPRRPYTRKPKELAPASPPPPPPPSVPKPSTKMGDPILPPLPKIGGLPPGVVKGVAKLTSKILTPKVAASDIGHFMCAICNTSGLKKVSGPGGWMRFHEAGCGLPCEGARLMAIADLDRSKGTHSKRNCPRCKTAAVDRNADFGRGA